MRVGNEQASGVANRPSDELLPRVGASTSPGTSIGVPRGASRGLRGAFAGCAGGPSPDLWTTPLRGCREAWRGSLETTVEGRARRTLGPPRRARRRSSRGLRGPPHRRRGGAGRRVSETSVKGGGRPRRVAPPSMSRASRRVVAEGVGVVCGPAGKVLAGGVRGVFEAGERGRAGAGRRVSMGLWGEGVEGSRPPARGRAGAGGRVSMGPPGRVLTEVLRWSMGLLGRVVTEGAEVVTGALRRWWRRLSRGSVRPLRRGGGWSSRGGPAGVLRRPLGGC